LAVFPPVIAVIIELHGVVRFLAAAKAGYWYRCATSELRTDQSSSCTASGENLLRA
jgi:hypothetical protein